ncbi:MAG: helix-turn-helix domain-containing protein [Firmicutes bacterium]|nr:helix-turn-helix domain-containing protein [Bacillota bacterium]
MRDNPAGVGRLVLDRDGDPRPSRGRAPLGARVLHAVERAVQLLDTLARGDAGISQVGHATGLHKATVHRLLGTLGVSL